MTRIETDKTQIAMFDLQDISGDSIVDVNNYQIVIKKEPEDWQTPRSEQ